MDRNMTKDLLQMMDFNERIGQLTKANSVHWYGHVSRKVKNNFLRRALDIIVKGTRKRVRPRKT